MYLTEPEESKDVKVALALALDKPVTGWKSMLVEGWQSITGVATVMKHATSSYYYYTIVFNVKEEPEEIWKLGGKCMSRNNTNKYEKCGNIAATVNDKLESGDQPSKDLLLSMEWQQEWLASANKHRVYGMNIRGKTIQLIPLLGK